MQIVAPETIREVAELAGTGLSLDEFEATAMRMVGDAGMARRVIDWLPEAFGLVLVSHMGSITLPTSFMARSSFDSWIEIPFEKDPIFGEALKLAQHVYHHGPRDVFRALAVRSSVVDTVNRALNAGESIEGAVLSPILMHGIPAETYGGGA